MWVTWSTTMDSHADRGSFLSQVMKYVRFRAAAEKSYEADSLSGCTLFIVQHVRRAWIMDGC